MRTKPILKPIRSISAITSSTVMALIVLTVGSAQADSLLPNFETLVVNESRSVVNIQTKRSPASATSNPSMGDPRLPEFLRRFRQFQAPPQRGSQPQQQGIGSGVIASADGYILTNAHVVEGASEIIVQLHDQRELIATLIGADTHSDIAVLKVEAQQLPAARFGNSDDLNVGQWVLAIGAPFGLEQTATQGIVSAVSRNLPNDSYVPFIQTDVAVNPGNSGGPLFNLKGEVIGINSQIFSRTGGYMGLSFAIPINLASNVAERLKVSGKVDRGWLGIAIQDLDQGLADSFGLESPRGALISRVEKNSPADRAQLRAGDVIVEFAGHPIGRSAALPPLVAATMENVETMLRIIRDQKSQEISITIGLLVDDDLAQVSESTGPLGIVASDITRDDRAALGINNGVRIEQVESGKPAAIAGLQQNDVIVSFNHKPIDNVAELAALSAATKPGSTIPLLVQRQRRIQFLAVQIPLKQPS
jgi:serine protease Do